MTNNKRTVSRRTVLKGTAGLVIAMHLPPNRAPAQAATAEKFAPNAFVRIGTDNIVTVLVKHLEMGQGPLTGLSTLVAEELDADWSQIRAEHAPANTELYKNLIFGAQATGGSSTIANSYMQMRRAGATARSLLVQAAANTWKVPITEITVKRGVIQHRASGRSGRFGGFAAAAANLPVPEVVGLKNPSKFRLIGREGVVNKLDVPAKTDGTARYTIDIHEPGMLTVVVAHPPRFGALVASFDATETRAVNGVVDVRQIDSGVAVYAKSTWPAIKGRERLKIVWDEGSAEKRSTAQLITEFRTLAQKSGAVAGSRGNAEAALAKADKVVEAEFVFPYLAHAPMEPLDGYLRWHDKGAVARLGCQSQTVDQTTIANILGLEPRAVEIETLLAGGSFGRRGQFSAHFAIELAQVAKAIGPNRPIKLIWTREDDIRGGHYRSLYLHRLRGSVQDGRISAWDNTIVGQSFVKGTPMEGWMIQNGVDVTMVEGSRELLYQIPDFRCQAHIAEAGVPTLWWRSVGHSHTGYAVECFVDKLLQATGQDPIRGRLKMMAKQSRAVGVLRAVARLANWTGSGPENGRARGVAVVKSFGSFVAQIAEISDGGASGPRVHKVWCAVDCGVAVNPDVIRAQMEGGIGYGLGHALYAEIGLDAGRVEQSNFYNYRSLRINEMPEVEVVIVPSIEIPTGVGEPGLPPIAPAGANAMARLGLGRPRQLPMVEAAV